MQEFKVGDRVRLEGVISRLWGEGGAWVNFTGSNEETGITREEMAHAKLLEPARKPRYVWSTIPPEYDWMATDRGGTVYAYKNKPVHDAVRDYWYEGKFPAKYIRPGSFTADWRDSLEQRPEEVEAAVKVAEEKVLDLSKPMRTKNNKVPVNYLTTDRLGLIWVQEVETKIVLGLFAGDLENIPEPKKTTSQEVYLHEHTDGFRFFSGHISRTALISKARFTHTDGEGWSIEEVE